MNTSKPVKLAAALVLAAAFASLAATPAFAKDDHGHGGHRGHDRGHYHGGHWGGGGVYVDPYYDPQPSPGINVVLPLNIHF